MSLSRDNYPECYIANDVRLGLGWGLQLGFSLGQSVNSQSERVWTRLEEI